MTLDQVEWLSRLSAIEGTEAATVDAAAVEWQIVELRKLDSSRKRA